jgi:hypothetical protein
VREPSASSSVSSRALAGLVVLLVLLHSFRSANAWDISQPGSEHWQGFEVGPTVSLPLPTASGHPDAIGFDVGLSFTQKSSNTVGIGIDFGYHYWPVSAEFKQEFNEFLGDQLLNTLELGGGAWGLQVLQLGAHVRFAKPEPQGVRPWLKLGAGTYRVDPYTTGYNGDAGFFSVQISPLKHQYHFGSWVTGGVDLVGGPHARMGVNASYHFVNTGENFGDDLHFFTLGVHALVGK